MRRHWSRFTPKSQSTEHNSYYTCNLALHKPLWRTQSIFLFLFGWWDKASASRERHWPPYRCTALFGTSSFRVRFSIYAPPSLPHFFISCLTTASSFFSGSCSIPKHCKGASTSPQWFGKFFPFSIVGLVLRPSLVGRKLEPFMVVLHTLFVDDENRGDSICHFASLLLQVMELPFHNFLFF